jgi:hypothetical protein
MTVTTERFTVRQAADELGIDGAELYRMIFAGDVVGTPNLPDANVYITRAEVERLRSVLTS